MAYEIEVVEVEATPLAAIAARAEPKDFARQIWQLFNEVYAFLKTHESLAQFGHNVIVYDGAFAPGSHVEIPAVAGKSTATTTTIRPDSGPKCCTCWREHGGVSHADHRPALPTGLVIASS